MSHRPRLPLSGQVMTRSKPSVAARLLRLQLRWLYRPLMHPRLPVRLQRAVAGMLRWTVPRPAGVRSHPLQLGSTHGDSHCPPQVDRHGGPLIHFHGGGYTVCSPQSHRSLAMHLALATGRVVHLPRYRLAPEHPYPAQLQDALRALADLELAGVDLSHCVLSGDSAGAHLALTTTLARRDAGLPLPQALVLLSPCADWALVDLPPPQADALLGLAWARAARNGYVPPSRYREPLVSPIHADLRGLPPTLIQSAGAELFARDAQRLHGALETAGVPVTWHEWPGLWHDFPLHAALLPEGRAAVAHIATFIRGVEAAQQSRSKGMET